MGETPLIVGHRANSGRIIFWYKRMGVEYVEVDVNLGRDGTLLVRHGPPGTRRATPIGRLIQWVDYHFFYRDPLLRPQPLHVWLRLISEELDLKGVLLDLKARVDPDTLAGQVEESGFQGMVMVSANDHRLLPPLRRALPRARLIASFNVMPVDIVSCARASRAHGIGVRIDLLDDKVAARIKGEGYMLSTWTVNDPAQARRAAGLGADIIVTDRPDIVKKALAGQGG